MDGFLIGAIVAFAGVALGTWLVERWHARLEQTELDLGQTIAAQHEEILRLRSGGRDASAEDLGI